MSDLLFCCFQKIFFVFCRIFIGPLRKVAHLTKKINKEIMKNHTRLPPFAHKNTLRKCLHFSLIRVNNWKFWTEPLWVGFQWTKPPQLGSSLSGQKRRYNFSTKNCSKRATEYLSIFSLHKISMCRYKNSMKVMNTLNDITAKRFKYHTLTVTYHYYPFQREGNFVRNLCE